MAIFLPLTASPTFTSLGGMAHCVPESNSVDSMSLPSGKRSPTLMAIAGSPVVWGKAPMIPLAPAGYDARMSMAWLRSLAVIVALIGALLLLASGLGVRLGLWTYGTGFALLRYAGYTGIAAGVPAPVP